MGRPKTVADAEILDATAVVIGRRGPTDFTLREVGEEVGLSPSTILQRFHSKRGLLVALVAYGAERVDHHFEAAIRRHPRPLDALVTILVEGVEALAKAGEPAHHLAFLQMDLADPDLKKHTRAFFTAMRVNIETLLEDAIQAGALEEIDVAANARAIEALYHGSLVVCTVETGADAAAALRRSLGILLGPHT